MITTLIAEHLNSLIIVSAESILNVSLYVSLEMFLNFSFFDISTQESLFAKQLVVLATFPESKCYTFYSQCII